MAYGVYGNIVNLYLLLYISVTFQYFLQADHYFQHLEGLYNIVFGTFFKAFYFACDVGSGGEKNDGNAVVIQFW